MADATTARLDGGSGAAPCGRVSLDQAAGLACGCPVHTAWPEASPDAPRRGINHLIVKAPVTTSPATGRRSSADPTCGDCVSTGIAAILRSDVAGNVARFLGREHQAMQGRRERP